MDQTSQVEPPINMRNLLPVSSSSGSEDHKSDTKEEKKERLVQEQSIDEQPVEALCLHLEKLNLKEQPVEEKKFEPLPDPESTALTIITNADDYRDEGELGKGAFGVVSRFRNTRTNVVYALKVPAKGCEGHLFNEAKLLTALKSDRIVTVYGIVTNSEPLKVLFEFCEGGDLCDWMKKHPGRLSDAQLWNWFTQLTEGLAYLHEGWKDGVIPSRWKTIVHGDIKAPNILVTCKGAGNSPDLKIADFGYAKVEPQPDRPLPYIGTSTYHPPSAEVFERYGPKQDVWAMGCVIHALAHRTMPYRMKQRPWASLDECKEEIMPKIKDRKPPIDFPDKYCEKMYQESNRRYDPVPLTVDEYRRMEGRPFPKLLSHFMMRALDMDDRTRISAASLADILPVINALHIKLSAISHADVLEEFNDGVDELFYRVRNIPESQALFDIAVKVHYELQDSGIDSRDYIQPLQQFMTTQHDITMMKIILSKP